MQAVGLLIRTGAAHGSLDPCAAFFLRQTLLTGVAIELILLAAAAEYVRWLMTSTPASSGSLSSRSGSTRGRAFVGLPIRDDEEDDDALSRAPRQPEFCSEFPMDYRDRTGDLRLPSDSRNPVFITIQPLRRGIAWKYAERRLRRRPSLAPGAPWFPFGFFSAERV
jgi:hypothetical protein